MCRSLVVLISVAVLFSACALDADDSPPAPTSLRATTPSAPAVPPDGEAAVLARVLDGDSIEVELSGATVEVRLVGINAPERDECRGDAGRDALTLYLEAGPITLVAAGDDDTDRFGRLLRYVYAGDAPIAEQMLISGHANVLQGDHPHEDAFVALADEAASSQLGMWQPDACGPEIATATEITKVEYNPAGPDRDNSAEEYVVIHNGDEAPVDLTDWIVRDESSQHRYRFPPVTLAPGAKLRLRSGCGDDGASDLYWCAGDAVWSNGGDTVLLQDPNGNVIDRVLYRGDY